MPASSRADATRNGDRAASRPRALKDVDDWLGNYRRFLDESLDRLDDYLKGLQAKGQKAEDNKK